MATVDYLYLLPSYPAEDTENAALEHHIVVGGPAGRGAIAAARLGGEVRLLATCGTGGHADVLDEHISREGIAATWVSSDTPSQHSAVILAKDNATRSTIWLGQPRADERMLAQVPAFVRGADVVLLDCTDESLTRAVVAAAARYGIPSVIDTGSFKAFSVEVVPEVDHVIAPKKWFTVQSPGFTSHDLPSWPTQGRRVLAATAGEQGGHYVERDSEAPAAWAAAGVDAIDTCGAGDTFHGAYAWAVGAGMTVDESFAVAAWSAGLKATAVGNSAIPTWEDLKTAAGGMF